MVYAMTGHGTFRPGSISAMLFGQNVPNFMDVSANKYGRFGQQNYYYYIAAEMFLRNVCLSSATLIAAAIVTNVGLSHYL